MSGIPLLCYFFVAITFSWQQNLDDDFDFFRLAHPEIADLLELTDRQRSEISALVSAAAEQSAATAVENREQILKEFRTRIKGLVAAEQLQRLDLLPELRKIRFNFSNPSWEEVLRWFARQADLSLVMGTAPSGDFNYSDNREYTPTQAIDLLNSILLTKGFTLVRRDKLLILVEIKDGIPDEILPRITAEELNRRGVYEVVTVTFSLGEKPVETVQAEIKPLLSNFGKAVLLPNSRQLLVTETAGKLRAISLLIDSIPAPAKAPPKKPDPPREPVEFRAFPLGSLDLEKTVEALKVLIPEANISLETGSRRVIIYSTLSKLELAQNYLTQLQADESQTQTSPYLQVYELVDELEQAALLEQLGNVTPQAKITWDASGRRLLVFAGSQQQQQIQETLSRLNIELKTEQVQAVRVFNLNRASAVEAQEIALAVSPRATVTTALGSSAIVVRASEAELMMIGNLIEQLETASLDSNRSLVLKSIRCQQNLPAEWLQTLQALVPKSSLQFDSLQKSLRFTGPIEDYQKIEPLILAFNQQTGAAEDRQLVKHPLSPAQRTILLSLLESSGIATDDWQILPSAEEDDFLAWIPRGQVEALQKWVDQIQLASPAEAEKGIRIYSIEGINPTDLSDIIKTFAPKVELKFNPENQQLTVVGGADCQEVVANILQQIDANEGTSNEPKAEFYSLEGELSAAAIGLLADLLPKAKASWDPATERLMVIASAREQQRVADLLKQLTQDLPGRATRRLQVYSLPNDLRARFEAILATYPEELGKVRLVPDQRPGEIALIATAGEHELIGQMIQQLLAPVAGAETYTIVSYSVGEASPEQLSSFLQTVFPDANIVVDPPNQRLMIWATAAIHQQIQRAIEQMQDSDPREEGGTSARKTLRSYRLQFDSPSTMLPLLGKLVPQVEVIANDRQALLVAWGKESDLLILQQAIDQLNMDADPEGASVEIYGTEQLDPQSLAGLLKELFPEITIVPQSGSNTLTVLATRKRQSLVSQALERLKTTADSFEPASVKVYQLQSTSNLNAITVLQSLVPEARVFPGPAADRLIALATASDHQRLEELTKTLDQAALLSSGRGLKSYQLRFDSAGEIRPILQTAFPSLLFIGSDAHRFAVWALEEEHQQLQALISNAEQELTREQKNYRTYELDQLIPLNVRTELLGRIPGLSFVDLGDLPSLTILASPPEHQMIEGILRDLSTAQQQRASRYLEAYRLESINLDLVIRSLPGELSSQLQIQADEPSQSLIVMATESQHRSLAEWLASVTDKLPRQETPVARIYPMGNLPEKDWRALFLQIAPTANLIADTASNSLVITTTPRIHQIIEQVTGELNLDSLRDRQVRVFSLKKSEGRSTLATLISLLPNCQVTFDAASNTIITVGSEADGDTARQTIALLESESGNALISQVYALPQGNGKNLATTLKSLFPSADFVADEKGDSVLAVGSSEQQAFIGNLVDQWQNDLNRARESRIYRLERADPQAAAAVLQPLLPSAVFAVDANGGTLAATATEAQHQQIQAIIQEFDQSSRISGSKTYPASGMDARDWLALVRQLSVTAAVAFDGSSNTVVVTGPDRVHETLAAMIQELQESGGRGRIARAYSLAHADVSVAATALSSLLPGSQVSPDKLNKSLIVVATPAEHEQLESAITQIDQQSNPVSLKSYLVTELPPESMARALRDLFKNDPAVSVVSEKDSRTVIAVAAENQHRMIEDLIRQAEAHRTNPDRRREFKTWSLEQANGTAVVEALNSLFESESIPPQLNFDSSGNRLVALATVDQQILIEKALTDFTPPTQLFRVFRLRAIEADAGAMALRSFFRSQPFNLTPTIDVDYDSQQLLIRATAEQMEQVEQVLNQLGESQQPLRSETQTSRNVRVFAGSRDWAGLIEQVQLVWPEMSPNRLTLIRSADQPILPGANREAEDESPAILAFSEPERLILVSADSRALDQLQSLIQVLNPAVTSPQMLVPDVAESPISQPTEGAVGTARNFDIISLKHAGAEGIANQLRQIFKELERSQRGILGLSTSRAPVVFGTDERSNTLIVHGSRSDRQTVRELVKSLDTAEIPVNALMEQPDIISVRNTDANRIVTILNSLYKNQLTSGGGRKQIPIPEGLSPDIASVLQQINAAASGPLLTLGVDGVTNSIIVMAPQQLREQIAQVIVKLDQIVATEPGEEIEIIKFENSSPERIEKALEILLQQRARPRR
jgi:type II secretory pathway component GspD/PulD (secretin)